MPLKTYTYDDLLNGTASTDAHYYLQSEADEYIEGLKKERREDVDAVLNSYQICLKTIRNLKGKIAQLEEDVAFWKSKAKGKVDELE